MPAGETHEFELDFLDREIVRTLAEKGPKSCVGLSKELKTDLRLIDRSVLKLLHNGLITTNTDDVCATTAKGMENVPKATSGSFRERLHRFS